MKKTLLLCFIHGFKGGDDTFGDKHQFPEDLRARLAEALPKINVEFVVYPKYETKGDLGECVSRFRDWLLEKVIDLEVAAGTPSPTVDPSVRLVLLGHSMGGIVAAETAIGLATDAPISTEDGTAKPDAASSSALHLNSLMFPYIQGVLSFDTPYLGISPGVVAHNAEEHYSNAAAAYNTITSLWGGSQGTSTAAARTAAAGSSTAKAPVAALPAPSAGSASAAGGWGKWGKMAMYAGAAGALAAGGAAAWYNRDNITQGMSWVTSHLAFVGCLARAEELKKRVAYMLRLNRELGVGFANLYTRLGKSAPSQQVSMVGTVLGQDRTFCNVPSKQLAGTWRPAVNSKASDEITAHMTMFEAKDNPEYQTLANDATNLIHGWLQNEWYESSREDAKLIEN